MERRAVSAGMLGTSSTTNSCNDSSHLRDGGTITELVVFGACALSLVAVSLFWICASRQKPGIRAALQWWNYGAALLLGITFYILGILVICLTNCEVTDGKQSVILSVVAEIVLQLAGLLLLAVILLPFTFYLLGRAGQKTRVVGLVNKSVLVVVALLLPAYLVTGSLFSLSPWIHHVKLPGVHVILDISTAYTCVFLFGSVLGALLLLVSLLKTVGDIALPTTVKLWTLFTLSSFVLSNAVLVVDIFGWVLPEREIPKVAGIIITVLGNFFLTATFAGLLMAVSSSEVVPYDPSDDATFDPDEIEVRPKRFTYTGTVTEIEATPTHRYSRSRYSITQEALVSNKPSLYHSPSASSGYRGSGSEISRQQKPFYN